MSQAIGVIGLDAIESDAVRAGVDYWRRVKRSRSFPSRRQIVPRELGGLVRNLVLVAVLDGGTDYAFRIWGGAHVQAAGFNMQGSQIHDLRRVSPVYAEILPRLYARVVETRQPIALRAVRALHNGPMASENVLLPVGKNDASVDHIMVFSAYTPVDFLPEQIAC